MTGEGPGRRAGDGDAPGGDGTPGAEGGAGRPAVDHLVYAAPDLETGTERIRELLGVEPVAGGRHERWGTHNALVGLGGACYLEVIAPDPAAPPSGEPRPFGLDRLERARLAGWAVRTPDLVERSEGLRAAGVDPGPVLEGRRERPDGRVLRWRLTDPAAPRMGGVVPFLIDWGASPHPAADLSHSLTLAELRVEHPDPEKVRRALAEAGVLPLLRGGPRPTLVASVEGPRGRLELR